MGKKSKTSRKGKKAWRANISTEDIEDFFDNSIKDALSGGSLADVPSDSLAYVDKSGDIPARKKIEKKRDKMLHYESLLQKNVFVKPVPSSCTKKSKMKSKGAKKADDSAQVCEKDAAVATCSGIVGIWNETGEQNVKRKKMSKTSIIPAVEVDPPGCSFNPPPESHQDALAAAVADEMQKVYQDELGPEPVPLTVPGDTVDEENLYFLDVDDESDADGENMAEDGNLEPEKRMKKTKVVTRVEKNKRARRKEQLKAEAEAQKVKNLSKEIDSVTNIIQEIAKEDEEKQKRHLRRVVSKLERLKSCPPRLGKRKFHPAPVQVLLSEEITGSLRQLKGCCTLAKDRFKSLEKRGLVVPSKKSGRR
ncbi:unnamed protein product [Cuscuta campestris]|uniref:Ribosome biogenesis protein NOP53 n=2 Tax=Cuscuta sect. Cleistogrammica TaxID=1824901 RepID=A0A484MQ14_9ASTE|nr:hypothetical protein DM860_013624 [Cuscuta australis]VFQ90619.1 unnamed protein product [Cuscuta campestris]